MREIPANRNAFGDLIAPPERWTQEERVALVREAAKSLKRGQINTKTGQWLAAILEEHLAEGTDLQTLMGLRPKRGSTRTAQRIVATQRHAGLLLRLSVAVGGDRAAARVLAGKTPCPARAKEIFAELAASPGPKSQAAFSRARAQGDSPDTR